VVGGGYATVTMTDSGVAGLAAVTAASLVVAGTIIVVAFRLKTRVQPSEEGDRI
jgi:hypothetical protein